MPRSATMTQQNSDDRSREATDLAAAETPYRSWLSRWEGADQGAAAARTLLMQCHSELGWLNCAIVEQMTTALLDAFDAYPELAIDHPPRGLANAVSAATAVGAEQALSNLVVAQRIDPSAERTLAVLIAGQRLIEPSIYDRKIEQWLRCGPTQAHVTRLMRSLAEEDPLPNLLDVIGRLAAHGTGRPGLSTSLVAQFAHRLKRPSEDQDDTVTSGAALVRARQAVEGATPPAVDHSQDTAVTHLATVQRLRSHLQMAGYDAAKPPRSPRGRTIDNPSRIGGWLEFVSRQGGGFLGFDYFETEIARRDPIADGLTASAATPFELARTPKLELPVGRFQVTFRGQVKADALLRCEVRGYTGRREQHSLAVSTQTVRSTASATDLGVLVFMLDERAADVVVALDVLRASGPVTLAGVDIQRMND